MLVVGTKGRSLGGIQGLVNTRNSFSKYCLQYSPVPVVVVRPDDKRAKKKEKRTQDPSRHSYAAMLAHNAGKHEADSEVASVFELEKAISADEEAHHVATAIGLPAAFDPTIKPFHGHLTQRHQSPSSDAQRSASPAAATTTTQNDSGDEESGDDEDEYEIEAVSAQQVSRQSEKQAGMEREQKARLHAMEVGEAKALLKSAKDDEVEEDDDDDESQGRSGDKT
ncbi:hypothetical protein B0T14DRAFT_516359 [Immersiella caudata]|uniref:UspA domain-containing protein n=1 Tax=Immersiella caudata TaxID=314043 RepID=A0AA39WXR8_9PEZI|nr:hypothetical protein B0T14DRAFT_516359 [Immersiella caudata]